MTSSTPTPGETKTAVIKWIFLLTFHALFWLSIGRFCSFFDEKITTSIFLTSGANRIFLSVIFEKWECNKDCSLKCKITTTYDFSRKTCQEDKIRFSQQNFLIFGGMCSGKGVVCYSTFIQHFSIHPLLKKGVIFFWQMLRKKWQVEDIATMTTYRIFFRDQNNYSTWCCISNELSRNSASNDTLHKIVGQIWKIHQTPLLIEVLLST